MTILIADDSELIRDRLHDTILHIKKVGAIWEAENGIDALELIIKNNPGLVILDIRMPEMIGIKVLEKMREMGSKSKVCIFTSYPYPQYKKK